jgi:hypothetical protein
MNRYVVEAQREYEARNERLVQARSAMVEQIAASRKTVVQSRALLERLADEPAVDVWVKTKPA